MGVTDLDRRSWTDIETHIDSSRDQERLLVRTVTLAPTIVRRCSGDCQRPEETVTDRERLKMGITDLNGRSWKGRNSYRFFQRPGEAVIYNCKYTPTIAETMRWEESMRVSTRPQTSVEVCDTHLQPLPVCDSFFWSLTVSAATSYNRGCKCNGSN